jgi:hypothetical protein
MNNNKKEIQLKNPNTCEHYKEVGCVKDICECYTLVPKQETIEQVAERILANNIDGLRDALKDDDLFFFYKGVIQCYGEAMVEWQKEQGKELYSKEDMIEASKYGYNFHKTTQFPEQDFEDSCIRNTQQWLTQFKKEIRC